MGESDFEQLEAASVAGLGDFVPVVFADNQTEAERLRALLEAHDIPTLIDAPDPEVADSPSLAGGIPLLVHAGMFDEATEILALDDKDTSPDKNDADKDDADEDDADDLDDDYEDDDEDDFDDYDDEDDDDEDFFGDDDEDEDDDP